MQSRWMSFVEAVTNIVVGYGLAVLTQIIVFPLFGLHASLGENLLIGGRSQSSSLICSYALRRLFNAAWTVRSSARKRINESLTIGVNDDRSGLVNHPAALT